MTSKTATDPPSWGYIGPGVQSVQLWKTDLGPKQPEVVLLRMNMARYNEFSADPLRWINDHHIFDDIEAKRVFLTACHLPRAKRKGAGGKGGSTPEMYVALHHDPNCTVNVLAYSAQF